jgi:hypothetical protein
VTPAVAHHAQCEARIAFVRYVEAETGNGHGAARIWQDAYLLGYQAALTPRSVVAIEADAAALLAAEYGVAP